MKKEEKAMNTKKLVKIVNVIMIVMLLISFSSSVLAADAGVPDPTKLTGTKTDTFNTLGNKIIGGIQAIGSIVSVAILVVLGIKYMMGSAEEKAEYKKTMIPYIVGAVLVFMASNIAGFIFSFANL